MRLPLVTVCSLLALALISPEASAKFMGFPKGFSADVVQKSPEDPGKTSTYKIFVQGNQARIEGLKGSKAAIITDFKEAKTTWVLDQKREYFPLEYQFEDEAFSPCAAADRMKKEMQEDGETMNISCKKAGSATVNGRKAEKYQTKVEGRVFVTTYFDPELRIVIKRESPEEIEEFKNIKVGAQNAKMFKVPSGYRKLTDKDFEARSQSIGGK